MHEKLAVLTRKNPNGKESSSGTSQPIRAETLAREGKVLSLGEVGTDHFVRSSTKTAETALFPKGEPVTIVETLVGKDGKSLSLGEPFKPEDPLVIDSFVTSPFPCGRLSDHHCSHNTPG